MNSRLSQVARVAGTMGLAAPVLICLQFAAPLVGLSWGQWVTVTLLAGLLVIELWPKHAYLLGAVTLLATLLQTSRWPLPGYLCVLVGLLFLSRNRTWAFVALSLVGTIVLPKELFRNFYHWSAAHDWIRAIWLGQIFYASALWWKERKEGRPQREGLVAFASVFFFPAFAGTPVAFAPSVIWRERARSWRAVAETLALVLSKAAVIWLIARVWPHLRFSLLSPEQLRGMSIPQVWMVIAVNYFRHALLLSGTFDVVVTMARLFGWPIPNAFRWALLAWNSVELWRRWSVYSRKILLKLVYFPLGGGQRHRFRNVMLTFLASGVVLHSGWVGSPYWAAYLPGVRDWTVYFLLQGVWVCACLAWWRFRGKDPASDRTLRFSMGRVVATLLTQATTAWLHVLVFAPHVAWLERWRLMVRCAGVPLP